MKEFCLFPLLNGQYEKENIDESYLNMFESWILGIKSEFERRFQSFKKHGKMFTFIIKPNEIEENVLDLQYFQYLKVDNFCLEMIDFKSSTLWTDILKTLQKDLEKSDYDLFIISTCWASLPTKFSSLKKIAFAILSTFGSTYKCEQIILHMKIILNKNRSSLTTENSDACIHLKTTISQT